METNKAKNVDEYLAVFPEDTRRALEQVRAVIKTAAPDATETISYDMPAYKLNGILVYFAGYQNHIGFYATPTGHAAFKKDLAPYKQGKGSVQFPLNQPMPLKLIARIVQFRVKENEEKEKAKSGFLHLLSGPARSALETAGITTLKKLGQHREKDILALHSVGKASLPVLRDALKKKGLSFIPNEHTSIITATIAFFILF